MQDVNIRFSGNTIRTQKVIDLTVLGTYVVGKVDKFML